MVAAQEAGALGLQIARAVRRPLAIAQLVRGHTVTPVADAVCAARSAVYLWARWFRDGGIEALQAEHRGSGRRTLTDSMVETLEALLETTPQDHGYLRSGRSSELLAKELHGRTGVSIRASTVRRALATLDWVWRCARPTLQIADPRKTERLRAINRALACRDPGVEMYYEDEADFDLNPRISPAWRGGGAGYQDAIPTPG